MAKEASRGQTEMPLSMMDTSPWFDGGGVTCRDSPLRGNEIRHQFKGGGLALLGLKKVLLFQLSRSLSKKKGGGSFLSDLALRLSHPKALLRSPLSALESLTTLKNPTEKLKRSESQKNDNYRSGLVSSFCFLHQIVVKGTKVRKRSQHPTLVLLTGVFVFILGRQR